MRANKGERLRATDIALAELEAGVSAEHIITQLLGRAQIEVGLGWQEAKLSVAMEHRASSITESALHAVGDAAMRTPGALPEGSRGPVVIASSEGEWHTCRDSWQRRSCVCAGPK